MSEYPPLYRRLSFVVALFAVVVGPLSAQERDYTDELVKEAIAIGLKSTTKENLSRLTKTCIQFTTAEKEARFSVLTAKIMFYEKLKKPPSSKYLLEIIQTKSKDDAISGPCGNIFMALWMFNVTDEFGRPSKEVVEQCYANNLDWSIRSGCVVLLFRIDKEEGRKRANLIMADSNIPLRQKFSLIAPLYKFGYLGGYQIMADALLSPDPGIRLQLHGMMYYFEEKNGKEYARGIINTKKLVADALKQLESMQSQLKKNQEAQADRAKRAADRISAAKVEAPVAAPAETRSVKSAKSPSPAAANLLALKPQQPPPPAKKAKKAGTFSQVTSLAELRALTPARTATDWELRIAWADSGIENAPWKLLYVHCLYTGDKKVPNRKSVGYWGYHQRDYALGSIGWDMHYAPPGMLAIRSEVEVNRSPMVELGAASTERLYCAVVLTPLAGSYEVRVGGREPVIANISVKKAPDLSWTPLLKPRPAGAKDDGVPLNMTDEFLAAGPAGKESPIFFHRGTSRARGEQKLFAKMLPGQFPGIAAWRLYEKDGQVLGIPERMTPLQINAEISGGKLLLRGKGFTPYRPDLQFLAQWRINGKLVTAPRPGEVIPELSVERAQQMAELELKMKKTPEEFTVKIPLVLPAWLARRVKAGDKVSLTVLYSPSRWRKIRHPSVKMAEEMVLEEDYGCRQPVMSKPITFTVTKAMLAKARAAAKASSPPATQPAARSADRVKELKANLATFHLKLGQVLKTDLGYPGMTWILTTKPLPEELPQPGEFYLTWNLPVEPDRVPNHGPDPILTVRISETRAGEIIDHLAKEGFFARAKVAKGDVTLKPSTILIAGTSGHDPICYEVLNKARTKTLSDYVRRTYEKAVVVRDAKLLAARDTLVRKAISLKPSKGRIDRKSGQNPTGLDFSDVLKWSGRRSFVERFIKAPKPYDEKTNPLSPLSDPSNGTPKRPTPKANS